jgi:hypothetical protein
MSGSIMPGPSATGRRRGVQLRFWLLMMISSVWVGGNIGLPGRGRRRYRPIPCQKCSEKALEQTDGSYKCENGHRFFPSLSDKKGKGKRRK